MGEHQQRETDAEKMAWARAQGYHTQYVRGQWPMRSEGGRRPGGFYKATEGGGEDTRGQPGEVRQMGMPLVFVPGGVAPNDLSGNQLGNEIHNNYARQERIRSFPLPGFFQVLSLICYCSVLAAMNGHYFMQLLALIMKKNVSLTNHISIAQFLIILKLNLAIILYVVIVDNFIHFNSNVMIYINTSTSFFI